MKPQDSNRWDLPLKWLFCLALLLLIGGCASNAKVTERKPTAFWPPYPDEPRIQYLTSFSQASDVSQNKSGLDDLIYGKEVQNDLPINKPYGAVMHDGKIYICDLRGSSVTILDLRKRQTLMMGVTGTVRLQTPTAIAISSDAYKYVADVGLGMIAVFDPQDRFVTLLGHKNLKPSGLAIYKNELYVCDFQTQRVEVLDRHDGRLIRTIGEPGSNPGQFIRPLGVTVDSKGNVYVADVIKCQLYKFDPQGKLISSFGGISNSVGGLVRPKHIAVDREGIIFVVDASFQNVQLFNSQGQVLTSFGSAGNHPGAMYLPAGITVHEGDLDLFASYIHPAFEPRQLILVTNQFGPNKVAVYALGRLKPGKVVADIAESKGVVPMGTSEEAIKSGSGTPLAPGAVEPGQSSSTLPTPAPAGQSTEPLTK